MCKVCICIEIEYTHTLNTFKLTAFNMPDF